MLLNSHDGIACDLCGSTHRGDFTYYSIDIQQIDVVRNQIISGPGSGPVIFSIDACQACLKLIQDAIKVNYRPTNVGVNCDLCNNSMRGDFVYYYCRIASVVVSLSNATIYCKQCSSKMTAQSAQAVCKCGGTERSRVAATKVDSDFLQLVACATDYEKWTGTVTRVRALISKLS